MNEASEASTTNSELPRRRKVCPWCGTADLLVSTRKGAWRSVLLAFNIHRYRCRACHEGFYRPLESPEDSRTNASRDPSVRLTQTACNVKLSVPLKSAVAGSRPVRSVLKRTVFASVAVILVLAVYFVGSSHSGSETRARSVQQFIYEKDVNRPGSDYATFGLKEPRPELCSERCSQDSSCLAFTFVRPVAEGAAAMCYLKTHAPAPTSDKSAITGIRAR